MQHIVYVAGNGESLLSEHFSYLRYSLVVLSSYIAGLPCMNVKIRLPDELLLIKKYRQLSPAGKERMLRQCSFEIEMEQLAQDKTNQ